MGDFDLFGVGAFFFVGGFYEVFLGVDVGVTEEEFAPGAVTVAAGAAYFLVVGFDGAWDVPVDDEAEVGAVYAHTEGVGGDDYWVGATDELFVGLGAGAVGHCAVVENWCGGAV